MNLIIPVPHPDKLDKMMKNKSSKSLLKKQNKDNPARSMPKCN